MNMLLIQMRLLGCVRGIAAWLRIIRHRTIACPIDDRECGADCMFWPDRCSASKRHNAAGQTPVAKKGE
jgi:hypothetical protein